MIKKNRSFDPEKAQLSLENLDHTSNRIWILSNDDGKYRVISFLAGKFAHFFTIEGVILSKK